MKGFSAFIICILTLFSCTYLNEEELIGDANCDLAETSFSKNITPIIENNCAVPACHVSGGQTPDLTVFSSIVSNSQLIKTKINNGTMPPPSSGKKLSQEEIRNFTCWIEEGTPNN